MSTPSLILVSGRFASPDVPRARDAAFAHALAGRGCDVRWVVPQASTATASELPAGSKVCALPVVSQAPRFAAVQSRLLDPLSEKVLMQAIRGQMPDLVHVLDYGGCTSVNLSWVTSRLGVGCVVSVPADSTVCHRGDLRYRGAEDCDRFGDPERCSACSLAPATGGLSTWQSVLGRTLGALRLPFNPYPLPPNFENRRELLMGGLKCADRVIVTGETERHRVSTLGLHDEVFEVLPPIGGEADVVESYLELYVQTIDRS